MPVSINKSPEYVLYREGLTAVDSVFDKIDKGIHTSHYQTALIQVIPQAGVNPTVEIRWWSAGASAYIKEHTPIIKAGVGAGVAYEFEVPCHGRIMMVAVNTISGGSVKIYVSGSEFLPNTY